MAILIAANANADAITGGYSVDINVDLDASISMGTLDARGAAASADGTGAGGGGGAGTRSKSRGDVLSRDITGDAIDLSVSESVEDDDSGLAMGGVRSRSGGLDEPHSEQTFTTVASAGTFHPLGRQGDAGATASTLAAFAAATPSGAGSPYSLPTSTATMTMATAIHDDGVGDGSGHEGDGGSKLRVFLDTVPSGSPLGSPQTSVMAERKHLAPNQDQNLPPLDDATVGKDGADGVVGGLLLDLSQVASMSKKLLVMASQPLDLSEEEDDATFSDELYEAYKGELWFASTSHLLSPRIPTQFRASPAPRNGVQTKR